jgi:hypothetical protein
LLAIWGNISSYKPDAVYLVRGPFSLVYFTLWASFFKQIGLNRKREKPSVRKGTSSHGSQMICSLDRVEHSVRERELVRVSNDNRDVLDDSNVFQVHNSSSDILPIVLISIIN